jgi:hypothetical protein
MARFLVALALLPAACEGEKADIGESPYLRGAIEVSPTEISLGPVQVGVDPPATGVVEVRNTGEGDLEIRALDLDDPDSPFSVGAPGTLLLASGASTEAVVTFDPPGSDTWTDTLRIQSNDPDRPVVTVDLSGQGLAPEIDLDPAELDLGAPPIGCPVEDALTVRNLGDGDLVVGELDWATSSAEIALEYDGELPFTLAPGEEVDLPVGYLGLDEEEDKAFLTVHGNDPLRPEVLGTVAGTAVSSGVVVETFDVPGDEPVDLLITLDRSESMEPFAEDVAAELADLAGAVVAIDAGWHLALVMADDGCVLGDRPYVDSSSTAVEAEAALAAMADLGSAWEGEDAERGFMLAEAALSSANTGPGGCNEGFYREEAALALVHVSASSEQSVNPYTHYVSLFLGMKDDPGDVRISAVAGDYPSGCGEAAAGTGYYEATVATGGLYLSICSSGWGSALAPLAEGTEGVRDRFELRGLPVPGTVTVSVDGVRLASGWAYDPGTNGVLFEPDHLPESGSVVEVSYEPLLDCER